MKNNCIPFVTRQDKPVSYILHLFSHFVALMSKGNTVCLFFHRFSTQISQHCVRAQIVAYHYSLTCLLDDIPSIRQSHFMSGQVSKAKVILDSGVDLRPDPR